MAITTVNPSGLADWLMGRGQHFATSTEIASILGIDVGLVPASLERAREAGRMVSVTKGGWVPVPPEYRQGGAPPPIHFIDSLMRHLGHPYYVGLLSAAALHGASHQAPMVLQVLTPARLRDRRIGSARLEFVYRRNINAHSLVQRNVPTGRVTVSSPASTVFDLVGNPLASGGVSNVATVIGDLLIEGAMSVEALVIEAANHPNTVIQRTGYLIELMAAETDNPVDLSELHQRIAHHDHTPLSPHKAAVGERDSRWRLILNDDVEHDL